MIGTLFFVTLFLIIVMSLAYILSRRPEHKVTEARESTQGRVITYMSHYTTLPASMMSRMSATNNTNNSNVQQKIEKSLSFKCPDLSEVIDVGNIGDIKWFFREVFCPSNEPLAVLLTGPPASGKTLLVMSLCEALGNECLYVRADASELTGPGLRELLLRHGKHVKLLILDEIDKARKEVYEILLSIVDPLYHKTGKVHATAMEIGETKLKVIALANSLDEIRKRAGDIANPLLSRFIVIKVQPYKTLEEYISALRMYLVKKYGLDTDIADKLARQMSTRGIDWRKIEQIAKVARHIKSHEDLNRLLKLVS